MQPSAPFLQGSQLHYNTQGLSPNTCSIPLRTLQLFRNPWPLIFKCLNLVFFCCLVLIIASFTMDWFFGINQGHVGYVLHPTQVNCSRSSAHNQRWHTWECQRSIVLLKVFDSESLVKKKEGTIGLTHIQVWLPHTVILCTWTLQYRHMFTATVLLCWSYLSFTKCIGRIHNTWRCDYESHEWHNHS